MEFFSEITVSLRRDRVHLAAVFQSHTRRKDPVRFIFLCNVLVLQYYLVQDSSTSSAALWFCPYAVSIY